MDLVSTDSPAINKYRVKLRATQQGHDVPEGKIIHLANGLGRTASSIAMRLNNFASVDPYHQQRGMGGLPGGKKQVEPI